MDLLIEDQLLRPSSRVGDGVRKPSPVGWPPSPVGWPPTPGSDPTTPPAADTAATATVPLSPATSTGPTPDPTAVSRLTPTPEATTAPAGLAEEETPQLPAALASTVVATAMETLPTAATTVPSPAVATTAGAARDVGTSPAPETSPGAWGQVGTPATPVSPTIPATPKQALEEEDIRNIIGECRQVLSRSSCARGSWLLPTVCLAKRSTPGFGHRWEVSWRWWLDSTLLGCQVYLLLTLEPTVVSSQFEGLGRAEGGLPGDGSETGSSLGRDTDMAEAVGSCLQNLASTGGPREAEPRLRRRGYLLGGQGAGGRGV